MVKIRSKSLTVVTVQCAAHTGNCGRRRAPPRVSHRARTRAGSSLSPPGTQLPFPLLLLLRSRARAEPSPSNAAGCVRAGQTSPPFSIPRTPTLQNPDPPHPAPPQLLPEPDFAVPRPESSPPLPAAIEAPRRALPLTPTTPLRPSSARFEPVVSFPASPSSSPTLFPFDSDAVGVGTPLRRRGRRAVPSAHAAGCSCACPAATATSLGAVGLPWPRAIPARRRPATPPAGNAERRRPCPCAPRAGHGLGLAVPYFCPKTRTSGFGTRRFRFPVKFQFQFCVLIL